MVDNQGGLKKNFSVAKTIDRLPSRQSQLIVRETAAGDRTITQDVLPFRAVLAVVTKLTKSAKPLDETLNEMANIQSQFAIYVYGESLLPNKQPITRQKCR